MNYLPIYIALALIVIFKGLSKSNVLPDTGKINVLKNIISRFPFVYDIARKTHVPVDLVVSIIAVESGGNPNSTGSVGEIGLMQITFGAVEQVNNVFNKSYNIFELSTPVVNIEIGCLYLKYLRDQSGGWNEAIQAYNAGLAGYKSGVSLGYLEKVNLFKSQMTFI